MWICVKEDVLDFHIDRKEGKQQHIYILQLSRPSRARSQPSMHTRKPTKDQIHKSTQSNDLIESPSNPRSTSAAKSVKHVYYSASYILALPRLYGLIPSSSTHNPASRTYISLTQPALIAQSLPLPCPSSPPKAAPNPPIQQPAKSVTESLLTITKALLLHTHRTTLQDFLPGSSALTCLPRPISHIEEQHWTLVSRMGHLP